LSDRNELARRFIASSDFAGADRRPLAGDASNRRYDRLHRKDGAVAVLMDADPAKGEDVRPFVHIGRHLTRLNLSAPRILMADTKNGFLLLEDLGDDLYARVLPATPEAARAEMEIRLYSEAVDVLARLHLAPLPEGIAPYDAKTMTDLAALSHDWYRSATQGEDAGLRDALTGTIRPLLDAIAPSKPVLILRDYHAENLIWLPDRAGVARVGLLDFQDAMSGHPAYDLVSLLQDARRDVPPAVATAMLERFCAQTGHNRVTMTTAFHLLGAQRNLRILGVFARLCVRDGRARYVDLIPRVWAHLQRDLAHPALAALRGVVTEMLPEPEPEILDVLRSRAARPRQRA